MTVVFVKASNQRFDQGPSSDLRALKTGTFVLVYRSGNIPVGYFSGGLIFGYSRAGGTHTQFGYERNSPPYFAQHAPRMNSFRLWQYIFSGGAPYVAFKDYVFIVGFDFTVAPGVDRYGVYDLAGAGYIYSATVDYATDWSEDADQPAARVGGGPPSTTCLEGGIHEVRVYNRLLSENEMRTIMSGRPDTIAYGLVRKWLVQGPKGVVVPNITDQVTGLKIQSANSPLGGEGFVRRRRYS